MDKFMWLKIILTTNSRKKHHLALHAILPQPLTQDISTTNGSFWNNTCYVSIYN